MQNLPNALLISVIGMGLVFIAILLLWGLMELLVRLSSKGAGKQGEETKLEESGETAAAVESLPADQSADKKRRAAAIAVAAALTLQRARVSASPDRGAVNAWQSVLRASSLNQRANLFGRKARGR